MDNIFGYASAAHSNALISNAFGTFWKGLCTLNTSNARDYAIKDPDSSNSPDNGKEYDETLPHVLRCFNWNRHSNTSRHLGDKMPIWFVRTVWNMGGKRIGEQCEVPNTAGQNAQHKCQQKGRLWGEMTNTTVAMGLFDPIRFLWVLAPVLVLMGMVPDMESLLRLLFMLTIHCNRSPTILERQKHNQQN